MQLIMVCGFHEIQSKGTPLENVIYKQYSLTEPLTEAVKYVINFGFSEINYNRIESYHAVSNPASGKVMRKLGMRYEYILRQRCLTHNGYEDCLFYSILKSEYSNQIKGIIEKSML